jgi:hypothetical protein
MSSTRLARRGSRGRSVCPFYAPRGELCRVLGRAGCLILTLDSRHNPLHVLSNYIRRWTGRIYAERCYTVSEVRTALVPQPVAVTDVTAIYHVPFAVNFLRRNCAITRAPAPMPGSGA